MNQTSQPPEDTRSYDVIVLGGGAVGENAADRAGRRGLSVVVVESELVGGECSYWACMPSKALLRPGAVLAAAQAVPGLSAVVPSRVDTAAVLARRDSFASNWDDAGQVSWLDGAGIALVRGQARFTGPRELEVMADDGASVRLVARHAVVVATGSEPVLPEVDGLAEARPWLSREVTSAEQVPESLAILGGGVVAAEMAVAYADLGARVTVLARGERLLPRAEPFASREVADRLAVLGVSVRFGAQVTAVHRLDDGVHVALADGAEVVATEILVATGRTPRTTDLGLAAIGLEPGAPLVVDDALQVTAVPEGWLFAVGDVTGRTATTHQGKYDARIVGDVVAARFSSTGPDTTGPDTAGPDTTGPDTAGPEARQAEQSAGPWSRYRASADHVAVPQVVFTRPEVAWVGSTERQARDAGQAPRVVQYPIGSVAGASVAADNYSGTAQLVLDDARGVILGATFTGPDAAELLHAATVAIVGEVPLDRLWHAVPAYPTVSEVWLRLLETAGL